MRSLTLLVLALFALAAPASADTLVVPILGYDMLVAAELPAINEFEGKADSGRFQYFGVSRSTGVAISIHVEPFPKGDTKACATEYWGKASRNPLVKQASVKRSDEERFTRVVYLLEGEVDGQAVKSANANFYFVFAGGCADVHVSRFPFSEGDLERIAEVGETRFWANAG